MKLTKVAKGIFIIIWTGIFLGAACLVVKGGQLLEFPAANFAKQTLCLDVIKKKKTLFEYQQYPWVSKEIKKWALLEAVEYQDTTKTPVLLKQQEENKIEYTILTQNTDLPIIMGEPYYEEETTKEENPKEDIEAMAKSNVTKIRELKKNKDPEYLLRNFYVVDATTSADVGIFDVDAMLKKDFSIEKVQEPQILIYHTHGGTESFSDSEDGNWEESIIGVGAYLKTILENEYGYEVIHDTTPYDMIHGIPDRNKAYNQALTGVKAQLKKHPGIQVVIDLHRDGVMGEKRNTTKINGKDTAKIMLFNGLSRNKTGPIDYLSNPNLMNNLAFSLQIKIKAMEKYPNFATPNYLKGYRYNLHLASRSLLIELGNQNNTLEEAKNAMEPLANILNQVLE
ncbi:MAG: stage II sporulation protein P [Acetivibrio sp.]